MKKITAIIITILCSIWQVELYAQACGPCAANTALFPNPPSDALGIFPDSIAITQGQPIDTIISYLMPLTQVSAGQTATVTGVEVLSVNNIPSGINWNCDQFLNNCSYNPQQNRWGCVRFCGITTDVPGTVSVSVLIKGTGCVGSICQSQISPISFKITILPAGDCNPGFCVTPTEDCDELCATFEGLPTSNDQITNPNDYEWDFGNGATGTGKSPPIVCYDSVGVYYPTLITKTMEYVVTDISATFSGDWYCGDVEESICGTCGVPIIGSCPDLKFVATSGTTNFSSGSVDNTLAPSWSNLNVVLDDPAVTFTWIEDDPTSPDDLGGTSTIFINQNNGSQGAGVYAFSSTAISSGGGGVTGTVTLARREKVSARVTNTDTVEVLASPAKPIISFAENDTLCVGDSIILSCSNALTYQWFQDTTAVSSNSVFLLKQNGIRPNTFIWVQVSQPGNNCKTISDTLLFNFQLFPTAPVIQFNSGDLTVNNPNNFTVNWYDNGNLLTGENNDVLTSPSGSGPYQAEFINGVGCAAISLPFALCVSGGVQPLVSDTIRCCDSIPNGFNAVSTGFIFGNTSAIAWGISSAADGPIDSDADAQAAQQNGLVFLADSLGNFNFSTCATALEEGAYFATPFVIDNPVVEPLLYDTLNGCRPDAQLCPDIQGTGWVVNPLVFTFPDGSSLNINQSFLNGSDITQSLWDVLTAQGPFCLALSSIYLGNPNGTWTISVTNSGSTPVSISVPAFNVTVESDTCPALNGVDQVVTINSVSANVPAGQTKTVVIEIPPLPSNFPSINPSCNAFGIPASFYYKACVVDTTTDTLSVREVKTIQRFNVFPNPNTGKFSIEYFSMKEQNIELAIFNNLGQIVSSNIEQKVKGLQRLEMDMSSYSSGVYHINLITPNGVLNKRLLIE